MVMKRVVLGLVMVAVILGLSGLTYHLVMPEIVVANVSGRVIDEVIVELPSSRVVFGPIETGADSGIYHSASQADGVYRYSVRFAGAEPVHGRCGYVTHSDYGKRLQLVVNAAGVVECREANKIF